MKARWFWLGTAPFALVAILVFASSFGVGAHEADDSAKVERDALVALGEKECRSVVSPMFVPVSPAEIESAAAAQGIAASGWVKARFIGSPEELAASKGVDLAASGTNSAWTLTITKSGEKSVHEYRRIELPSGRVAWQPARVITTEPCE